MSNINDNKLSVNLTAANISDLKTFHNQFLSILPFLKGLSPEDRQALPKISVANKVFVEDAIMAAKNNPTLLPAYLNILEIEKDLILYQQLDEFVNLIAQTAEKLRDTQIIAGSEAFVSALTIYRLFEAASNAGMPGSDAIYQQLRTRFNQSPPPPPAPVPPVV